MDPESDTVLHELDDGVLVLTFNRPDRNNGYTYEMERAYFDWLERAAVDPEVRAIVVTGAGRSFCPGLDAQVLAEVSSNSSGPAPRERKLTLPAAVPKPIVCAINGACAGLGLVTALVCDIRFAARGAKLTTAFVRRGLPAEQGISWMLSRLCGHAVALDLLLSGRVVLAEEAVEIGLVHRVTEPEEVVPAAMAYARDLAQNCSPSAMAAIKAQVYADLERGLEDARRVAISTVTSLAPHPDFREGVKSFAEKRSPRFQPLSRPVDAATTRDRA